MIHIDFDSSGGCGEVYTVAALFFDKVCAGDTFGGQEVMYEVCAGGN